VRPPTSVVGALGLARRGTKPEGKVVSVQLAEHLIAQAARTSVAEEIESDDNHVRAWQDELQEAREKGDLYRSDPAVARAFRADAKHTEAVLAELPGRISMRRAEIAYDEWTRAHLSAFPEIPVVSKDRSFASIPKGHLEILAPELARAIPKKSALWADWTVWNFKRHRLRRAKALPAEAVQRARGSLEHFERLEVWQAVGMADPWLVGVMRAPSGRDRFYMLYDWGIEATLDRELLR